MKKSIALLSTILLAGATSFGSIVNANALLTPPNVVFDIAFRNNANYGSWYYYLGDGNSTANTWNWNNPGSSLPTFERTVDGTYYNYTNTTNFSGLEITQTYNRSNTGWDLYSGGPYYVPYLTNKIGSDNTVGSAVKKYEIIFDNQTSYDYLLFLDLSSSTSGQYGNVIYDSYSSNLLQYGSLTSLRQLYIPAYTNVVLNYAFSFSGSIATYLDAFYLEQLAQNDAYTVGYTDGQNDQILDGGGNIFTIIGNAFAGITDIYNIQILPGNITLGTVFGAIIAIAVLFAFLNLLAANPRMGKKK